MGREREGQKEGKKQDNRKECFLIDLNVGKWGSRERPDFSYLAKRPAVGMQKVLGVSGRRPLPVCKVVVI